MSSFLRHPLAAVAVTTALTLPWLFFWATGTHPASTLATVGVSGIAVLGSSFLLAWGAETAEKDVPRAFAIAVLAVLAVAPEYAVDALYAWQAGAYDGTPRGAEAANLAVANMTGANRILIGLGWSGIALFTIYRAKQTLDPAVERRPGFLADAVRLDRDIALEIAFLLVATAFAFLVPLGGGIGLVDTVVLVGLYALYISIIIRGDVEEVEAQVGVPAHFHRYPKAARVAVVLLLFSYSGWMIYTAVHPFAHGLEELGQTIGVPAFFMIQWIAPLASESPELIVVAYLVNKARSTAGFNALISSKLNQWTLLIGTLAVVYSIALGQLGTLQFDPKQSAEIWITAAQSFFAIAVLVNFSISVREAVALLVLFSSQVFVEFLIVREVVAFPFTAYDVLIAYSVVYIVLGLALFVQRRGDFRKLMGLTATTAQDAIGLGATQPDRAD
ncbi:sodium:calcium antiporter [Halegenticoccus tardaugens]|uniref:sodium:calcium antiporter n=1 Tax=Halegenticoccus tardaugens TaxID=2071624 RepID=UPI00100B4198|nr:sodium:calcium antiporter [Halegenticoccus tardaugens]